MRKALAGLVAVLAVALLIWGGLHVSISAVNPAQKSPEGHFGSACWACHFVRSSAPLAQD